MSTILITGSSGFIGYHLSLSFLNRNHRVIGIDDLNDYYDVNLKKKRQQILEQYPNFSIYNSKIEAQGVLQNIFATEDIDIVIHLAAQAGVRYSIENPRAYLEANTLGTFELLEAIRSHPIKHLLMASTSSVYGANDEMLLKKLSELITNSLFTRQQKNQTKRLRTHIHTPIIYQ